MQTPALSRQRRFNTGFLAGLLAGIAASAFMLLLSVLAIGISLPEVFGSFFTQLLPPTAFDYLHNIIGGDAKHYLFYGILVGQCLVFALSGGLCGLLTGEQKAPSTWLLPWRNGILLAAVLWLLTGLVFLPLTGAGIFGSNLDIGIVKTILSLILVGLLFGILFVYLYNRLITHSPQPVDEKTQATRRTFIRSGLIGIGTIAVGVAAWRFITGGLSAFSSGVPNQIQQSFKKKIVPPPTPQYGNITAVPGLSSEVTSNDKYYIVSKNLFSDPNVDSLSWSLTVNGAVEKPYTLNYRQIVTLPMKQQYESMMCISNEVGGPYMSNALWEGIPLADLLQRAGGIKPGATKVVLYAVDDYSDSIHLTKALEPTTLVALRMNGQMLPAGHGFPARLLVPGIYGMKHVKWINRIEVTNQDYQGYWQQRGWSDAAPIRLTSRIDVPFPGATLKAGTPNSIAGVAFSGNKGISEVDVSIDDGKSWQQATLKRPLSNLTWVLWELPWTPAAGTYTVVVRAIDMEGNVQDPQPAPPLPAGSSGYHTISVTVH